MSAARTGALGVGLAKGELYTLNAAGDLVKVAAGTTGQVLAADTSLAAGFGWIYPITSTFDPIEQANAFNNTRGRNIGSGAAFTHTMYVPYDFQSLVAVYVRFIAGGAIAAKQLTATTNYSIPGQLLTTHTAGPTAYVYSTSGSFDTVVDISTLFAASPLVADQEVGITIGNTDSGVTLTVLGTILVYRRMAV